jgi:hypothetical protein
MAKFYFMMHEASPEVRTETGQSELDPLHTLHCTEATPEAHSKAL